MTQISELKRQAEALLRQMGRGKEYIIGHVAERLMKAADDNAQDTVIRAVAHVIERRSRQDPTRLISQAEIEEAYQSLVGLNASGTRFREVCGDLLLSETPKGVEPGKQYAEAHRDPMVEGIEEIDPALRQGLGAIFDGPSDAWDARTAGPAQDKVAMELRSMGHQPRLRAVGGNARYVVIAADFGTNRGAVTVHIPVEASGNRLPSVFVAGDRLAPLTPANLTAHLEASAGHTGAPPSIPALLASLDALTGNLKKQASVEDVSSLASKLPVGNGSEGLSGPATYASMPEGPGIGEVEVPRTPVPEPLRAIASDIEESAVEAGCGYPQASVRLAKRMLYAELAGMGFRGAQVRICGSASDSLICEAVLDTPKGKVAIEVPIEMRENRPLMPTLFAQGDFCDDFSEASIKRFVARDPDTVPTSVRRDSPMMIKSVAELKDVMIKAVARQDYGVCEEILEAVSARFGHEEHLKAFKAYQHLLRQAGAMREAHGKSGCDRIIRNSANSVHPLCGHLMIPLHQVVQDEHGRCHRASTYQARQNNDDASGFFSNAKVLVGD